MRAFARAALSLEYVALPAVLYHRCVEQQSVGFEFCKGVEHHDNIAQGITLRILAAEYFGACLPPVFRGVQDSRQRARVGVDANAVSALRFGVKFLNDIGFVERMQQPAFGRCRHIALACYMYEEFKQRRIVCRVFFIEKAVGRHQFL